MNIKVRIIVFGLCRLYCSLFDLYYLFKDITKKSSICPGRMNGVGGEIKRDSVEPVPRREGGIGGSGAEAV
jgi:hypothetical protein